MAWSQAARDAAAAARGKAGDKSAYFTKPLNNGKVGVFRTSTGTRLSAHRNQASADFQIERQAAEDNEFRLRHINNYLDEREARPPATTPPSAQLDLFRGSEDHVHSIAHQHGIDTSHLK